MYDKVYWNYYTENSPGLLRFIKENISDDDIRKIFSLQLSEYITTPKSVSGLYGLSKKDIDITSEIFYKYIECDAPLFKYEHIYKYLKYLCIIEYNYNMIKLYDKLNVLNLYLNKIVENKSKKNAALVLFYFIFNKSTEEVLDMFDVIVNLDIYDKKKTNKNTKNIIITDLLIDMLSIDNMSDYYGFGMKLLRLFYDTDIFSTITPSQKSRVLKKLHGYSQTTEYKEIYKNIEDTITPTQFLDLKQRFEKDDIVKFVNVLSNYNKTVNYYIIKGLYKRISLDNLPFYFQNMCENNLINSSNSTIIMRDLLKLEEFLRTDRKYVKHITPIYELFIGCKINIYEIEEYFKVYLPTIWLGSIYDRERYFVLRTNKFEKVNNAINELKFLNRKLLINRIKNKIEVSEQT